MDVKKNVLYFGGGIKSQWFGHSMWTHGNIIAYPVKTFGAFCIHVNYYGENPGLDQPFPTAFSVAYFDNRCVLGETRADDQCNDGSRGCYLRAPGCTSTLDPDKFWVKMWNNSVYASRAVAPFGCKGFNNNFTAWAERFDHGSRVFDSPTSAKIVQWGRDLLGF